VGIRKIRTTGGKDTMGREPVMAGAPVARFISKFSPVNPRPNTSSQPALREIPLPVKVISQESVPIQTSTPVAPPVPRMVAPVPLPTLAIAEPAPETVSEPVTLALPKAPVQPTLTVAPAQKVLKPAEVEVALLNASKESKPKAPTKPKAPVKPKVAPKTAKPVTAPKPTPVPKPKAEPKPKPVPKEKPVVVKSDKPDAQLKVLFCISEVQPFAATGGLGEVGGGLPKALTTAGVDIRVMTPMYKSVTDEVRKKCTFLGHVSVSFAYRQEYCGVFEYKTDGVIYYFIDNEKYFKRDSVYGYFDDGERFAFFSKAILDTMELTSFRPDVLHANDWHTAAAVILLKTVYAEHKTFSKIKTLFTIHNINFQGKFPHSFMTDVLNMDYKYKNLLDFDGHVNLVKGAIECADMVNTVSPTYAEEIKTPEFAMGLESVIHKNAFKLSGILNSIDYKFYNPKKDKELFENYDDKTLELKRANKRGLQKLFHMQVDETIPMVLYNGRLTNQKGVDLIIEGVNEILNDRIQMIVMGNGDKNYEDFFEYIQNKYQGKFKTMRYSNSLAKKLYAAADLVLMPSSFEPCGLSQMIASRYGTVPIVRETGGLKDSIKDFGCQGGGNGYTFTNYSKDDMVYSLKRGLTDYVNDGLAWTEKMKICIKKDFSWKGAVKEYIALYKATKKVKNVKKDS